MHIRPVPLDDLDLFIEADGFFLPPPGNQPARAARDLASRRQRATLVSHAGRGWGGNLCRSDRESLRRNARPRNPRRAPGARCETSTAGLLRRGTKGNARLPVVATCLCTEREPVGLVMPAESPGFLTLFYVVVVPMMQRQGYVNDLLSAGTATLLKTRSKHDKPLIADTDVSNAPMAAAFERAGWARFAGRQEYVISLSALQQVSFL